MVICLGYVIFFVLCTPCNLKQVDFMDELKFSVCYERYNGLEELDENDKHLCLQAREALQTSYSPYSNFKVGAAIRLTSGQVVSGSNQENLAYPSGLCAERVALFTVGATHPDAVIESMAITAFSAHFNITHPVTSCGACLQVMSEFERKQGMEIKVLFYCLDGQILKLNGIKSLLPFAFAEEHLMR
jgi:cytidine deaminase